MIFSYEKIQPGYMSAVKNLYKNLASSIVTLKVVSM